MNGYSRDSNAMNQRMSTGLGAPPGGLRAPTGSQPPPPGGGQQPSAGTPMFQVPELQSLAAKLVAGDQLVLAELGRFQAWLYELVQEHGQGMPGTPQGAGPQGMPPMR